MRNVKSPVDSAFKATKNLGARGSACQTNIEITPECAWLSIDILHREIFPTGLSDSRVDIIQSKLIGRDGVSTNLLKMFDKAPN